MMWGERDRGRLPLDARQRLESYFREQGVAFEVKEHPTAYTAQQIAASEHVPGRTFAKVVIALVDGKLVMLVLPAPSMVDVNKVGEVVGGGEVRLATEREFAPSFPDCDAGAMPPFGNLYEVPVVVDPSMGESERIVFQAGTHDVTMSVAYADFARLVRPTPADIAVTP
jgi:Ala-tRNA(Pro) deacylase